jgi:hypothetical protein
MTGGTETMITQASTTARIPWHPPMVFEIDDHEIAPPTARLKMWLDRKYREGATWPEILRRYKHELELNSGRQARWREQERNPSFIVSVPSDGDMLNALVRWGRILDHEADDPKIVGKAIADVMAELIRNDPLKPSRW